MEFPSENCVTQGQQQDSVTNEMEALTNKRQYQWKKYEYFTYHIHYNF